MGITEFLEARITDDEARAKLVADARVLVECRAKRTILALHSDPAYTDEDPRFPVEPTTCLCKGHPCPTLRALAAIYADHPHYLKEWDHSNHLSTAYALPQ